MKNRLFIAVAAVAAMTFAGFSADAQSQFGGGPGIVMAGSQDVSNLPGKAKKFIDKHFKDVAIQKCEQYFAKGKYEVELANGVDIEFNSKGEVTEIDAPDRGYLSPKIAKELLHDSAFSRLEKDGRINKVESIEFKRGRAVEVTVDVPDPDTYVFDVNGVFIQFDD